MRFRSNRNLVLAGVVLSLAATASSQAATKHRVAAELSVSSEPSASGVVLVLAGVGAPAVFTCRIEAETTREVVIDLPGAAAPAQQEFDLGSPLLQSIRAETRPDVPGVRLRVGMGQATLVGIDQTAEALRLHFEPGVASVTTSAPAAAAPTDGAEYRVGPGDKLEISVFGHDDMTKVVEVRVDGTINFPLVGDIHAAGRTASEIDDILTKALGKDYLVDPQVSVDVKEYQSLSVTVLGEVRTPGRYYLKSNMRLIELLALVGGATREAGPEVMISRHEAGGMRQISIDLEHLFSKDNADANVPLQSGDIITIAERKAFYIKGEVSRPGPYFISNGMTLLKAMSVAGGLTQFANRRSVELLRSQGGGKTLEKIVIDLKDVEQGKAADIDILPDDIINVPRRIF